MDTCILKDFIQSLDPWLSQDYIREGSVDSNRVIHLLFRDGVKNSYRIADCTGEQLQEIITKIKERGIPFKE
jgi:hypothetical protein